MATTNSPEEIPKGSRILSGSEILDFTRHVIDKWQPNSEMWPLNWGSHFLGALATVSGLQVNYYFRKRLRLKGVGLLSTFIPCMVFPYGFVYKLHQKVISIEIRYDKLCWYLTSFFSNLFLRVFIWK